MIMTYQRLPRLFEGLKIERHPILFKEALLGIAQIYFDSLVEIKYPTDENIWNEQLNGLEAILKGLSLTVGGFYSNKMEIPFSEVKDIVLPYESTLKKYCISPKVNKHRHLAGMEFLIERSFEERLSPLINQNFDVILPVASGGFEPGALISAYLNIDNVLPVRYSWYAKQDESVLIPTQVPKEYYQKNLFKKKIIVADDMIMQGKTMIKILNWLEQYSPSRVEFIPLGNFDMLN